MEYGEKLKLTPTKSENTLEVEFYDQIKSGGGNDDSANEDFLSKFSAYVGGDYSSDIEGGGDDSDELQNDDIVTKPDDNDKNSDSEPELQDDDIVTKPDDKDSNSESELQDEVIVSKPDDKDSNSESELQDDVIVSKVDDFVDEEIPDFIPKESTEGGKGSDTETTENTETIENTETTETPEDFSDVNKLIEEYKDFVYDEKDVKTTKNNE